MIVNTQCVIALITICFLENATYSPEENYNDHLNEMESQYENNTFTELTSLQADLPSMNFDPNVDQSMDDSRNFLENRLVPRKIFNRIKICDSTHCLRIRSISKPSTH